MKVLYLTFNPNVGSTTRVLQEWVLAQRNRGDEPAVAIREAGPLSDWLKSEKILHIIDSMPWPDKWRPFSALFHAITIGRWAKQIGVELIHCVEHDVYPFAVLVRSLYSLPIACSVQFAISGEFGAWAFGTKLPLLARLASGRFGKRSPQRTAKWRSRVPDHLIWTSEAQRCNSNKYVSGIVAEELQTVVPLGISIDRFFPDVDVRNRYRTTNDIRDDQIVVGCACALRPVKRIHEYIEIIEQLSSERPNVVGLLAGEAPVGDEDYRDSLIRRMQPLIDARKLIWLGNLVDVNPFFQAVDIFVSSSEFETFGMSVCEAMAFGKPVAAYAASSVREVVADAGIIVETGDIAALTQAVLRLVDEPRLRNELGIAARERVGLHFDPRISLGQLDRIYQGMLTVQ